MAMLDDAHTGLPRKAGDNNNYTLGRLGHHNIVICCLPEKGYGTNNAASVAKDMNRTFPNLHMRFMVGIW